MLRFANLAEFERGLRDWVDKATRYTERVYQGFVLESFYWLVEETPQYSGNAAANWRIGIGQPTYEYDTEFLDRAYEFIPSEFDPRQKGDPEAVNAALTRELPKIRNIRLQTSVYLCNSATDEMEGAYIQLLEADEGGFLRSVNKPGHMVERRVNMVTPGAAVDGHFLSMLVQS